MKRDPDARSTVTACPVTLTAGRSETRGLMWVVGAFVICPCHLPLTMALAGTVLAGTTAGVLLRAYPLVSGILITVAWVAGTWRGMYHLSATRRSATRG